MDFEAKGIESEIWRALRISTVWILLPLLLVACSKTVVPEVDKECRYDIETIDFSFGIDYTDLDKYLIPGEQSDLKDSYLEEIRDAVGTPENNIEDVLELCRWINVNFEFQNAGGAMMGKNTVDELYEIKTFYGCHSLALIISSVLREFGFPAIMIETADVLWGYNYHDGTTQNFIGHVMSEVYVEDQWILLDNDGSYIEEYDSYNPFISKRYRPTAGYFVFAKGIDTWEYSERDDSFTDENMLFFAENIYCFENMFFTESYTWKP